MIKSRRDSRKISRKQMRAAIVASLLATGMVKIASTPGAHAFAPSIPHRLTATASRTSPSTRQTALWYTDEATKQSTVEQDQALPEISEMKPREMKRELESYGVSTKSMFDRADFEVALRYARMEGMTSTGTSSASSVEDVAEEFAFVKEKNKIVDDEARNSKATSSVPTTSPEKNEKKVWGKRDRKNNRSRWSEGDTSVDTSSAKQDKTSASSWAVGTRQELYDRAMQTAKDMKLADLKQELRDRGVDIKAFFEKADFVKAFANAIADKLPKKPKSSSSNNDGEGFKNNNKRTEEIYDQSYRDVSMKILDPQMISGEPVIDITDLFKEKNEPTRRI